MSTFGKGTRARKWATGGLVVLLVATGTIGLAWELLFSIRGSFRRLVMHPVPQSVQNIKMDQCRLSSLEELYNDRQVEHISVLRFDISKGALLRIVESRRFKLCEDFRYLVGGFDYRVNEPPKTPPRYGICSLYDSESRSAPDWFDLGQWANPLVYMLGQDDPALGWADASYLIYNEQLGSAYLIRYKVTSW